MEIKNYEGNYIDKITLIRNVLMRHNYDSRRTFFERKIYKIDFDNGDVLFTVLKPKKYQNCFNGVTFKLINTKFTREKIIFEYEEI